MRFNWEMVGQKRVPESSDSRFHSGSRGELCDN